MTESLYVSLDVLFRQHDGRWLASNPRLRTHVEVDAAAIAGLTGNRRLEEDEWAGGLSACRGRDATDNYFGARGLHTDHSGVSAECGQWLSGRELVRLLRERGILIASRDEIASRIAPLENPLDRTHLGTFHQRVGQYLFVKRRTREPWRAWQDQKFTPDGKQLLRGNYQHVQESFFDRHFTPRALLGARVVDFGCGNGYFSARFANLGASVLAFDSCEHLISLALTNHGSNPRIAFHLIHEHRSALSALAVIDACSVDLVYLQDTLVLLISPEEKTQDRGVLELLGAFRRILKPDGRLCAMEPNPSFWLASRYGDPQTPYAVVTEYRHPVFNVAPTLDRVMDVMSESRFALTGYSHPDPTDRNHVDYPYIHEFPVWDFLTFSPIP